MSRSTIGKRDLPSKYSPSHAPSPLDLEAVQLARLQQPGTQPVDLQQYDLLIGED